MLVSKNLAVNGEGHLTVGGIDTVELAHEYGTPLYVMDEDLIREHCRSFKQSMDKYYGGKGLVCYASKAFCCKAMCRIMLEEGLGLDVVSEGELYIGDRLVNDVAPKDRDIAMVFQNYALYPHMTVYDNMAFGLKLRKKPKDEIDKLVREAAKILSIEHIATSID